MALTTVSRLVGQVTFDTSVRTCCKKVNGFVFAAISIAWICGLLPINVLNLTARKPFNRLPTHKNTCTTRITPHCTRRFNKDCVTLWRGKRKRQNVIKTANYRDLVTIFTSIPVSNTLIAHWQYVQRHKSQLLTESQYFRLLLGRSFLFSIWF